MNKELKKMIAAFLNKQTVQSYFKFFTIIDAKLF